MFQMQHTGGISVLNLVYEPFSHHVTAEGMQNEVISCRKLDGTMQEVR